ncbi:MAG TPA: ABC transporter permease [Caulobacteraceae bacterium]|nr:ABC transporter permease [Caulobacteraceae bacterium]
MQSAIESRAGAPALGPRVTNGVNWVGLQTLYMKEVRRFSKVWAQTLAGPVVTTLLYMMIFAVALNGARPGLAGVSMAAFVGPGLIMMSILNNAFQNSSSSLFQSKINNTASDFLTPPLSPLELTIGFSAGAMTRGLLVGLITAAAVWPFSRFGLVHLWAVVYFAFVASVVMSTMGVLAALWSEKFDQLSAVTSFVVTPMTFLSGAFYLVDRLPEPFRTASRFNPFFYLIDGFRYGFIGKAEGSVAVGAAASAVAALLLVLAVWRMFTTGWRLKS